MKMKSKSSWVWRSNPIRKNRPFRHPSDVSKFKLRTIGFRNESLTQTSDCVYFYTIPFVSTRWSTWHIHSSNLVSVSRCFDVSNNSVLCVYSVSVVFLVVIFLAVCRCSIKWWYLHWYWSMDTKCWLQCFINGMV